MISSDLARQIARHVDKNFDSQVKFLEKLVKTPSVNPFTTETADMHEPVEKEMAEVISGKLKKMGLAPRKVGVSKSRPNVVCRVGPRRFRKSLIFNGHMDTAAMVGSVKDNAFEPVRRKKRLYGQGVFDMKASLSAFVYAVKTLQDMKIDLAGRLVLVFAVDGESGGCSKWGTWHLLTKGVRAKVALIGKPCSHTIAIGHRGGYRFRLTTKGEAVHTGLSLWEKKKMGKNAVVDMARVIARLQKLEIPYKSARLFPGRKPVLTFPTKIEGGSSVNVVPDECVAYGDVRLMPGNSSSQVQLMIHERLRKEKGLDYEIEDLLFVPSVEIDPKEELVLKLAESVKEVKGEKPSVRGVGPWNDGWMYITNDVPAICGFGPDGSNTDPRGEWVDLDSLKQVTEIYVRLVLDYLGIKEEE